MKNTRRAAALMLVFAFMAALLSGCTVPNTEKEQKTGLVNVKDEMYDASYWTAKYKQKDKVTLTPEEILHFNIRTIQNADSMEDAERTKALVEQKLPGANVMIENVGPVIGAHAGPGTIALCFIGSKPLA